MIFGGDEGHRAEVLGADIDRTGSRIVSCGMDHSLKVWSLTDAKIQDAIQLSYRYKRNSNKYFNEDNLEKMFANVSYFDLFFSIVDHFQPCCKTSQSFQREMFIRITLTAPSGLENWFFQR